MDGEASVPAKGNAIRQNRVLRRTPRVGHIRFLNCLPLYRGLANGRSLGSMELVQGVPTELNRDLLKGELDISPISSIEYARHFRKLLLLPDLTVSSDGEVKSILLVSRLPVALLDRKRVALSDSSATSQILVRLILEQKYGLRPIYLEAKPHLPSMLHQAEAALLIGDPALRALLSRDDLTMCDLGSEWKNWTGHKMVYAVWASREEFALREPCLVKNVLEAFRSSAAYVLSNLGDITADVARREAFDAGFLAAYFRGLQFGFDEEYREGLLEFYRRAHSCGFIEQVPPLRFVEVGSA
ncbi:MAG: menaquinone biosynthesis protein [Firmicutes bacterium]|nr:menaquinone biosynthesis protein [Bacillota bacterium]